MHPLSSGNREIPIQAARMRDFSGRPRPLEPSLRRENGLTRSGASFFASARRGGESLKKAPRAGSSRFSNVPN